MAIKITSRWNTNVPRELPLRRLHQLVQTAQRNPKHFLTSGFCFDRVAHARWIFQRSRQGKECIRENWVIKREKIEWKLSVPRWHSKRLNPRKYFSMQNVEVKQVLSLVSSKFDISLKSWDQRFHLLISSSDDSFPRQVLFSINDKLEWINVLPSHRLLSLDNETEH